MRWSAMCDGIVERSEGFLCRKDVDESIRVALQRRLKPQRPVSDQGESNDNNTGSTAAHLKRPFRGHGISLSRRPNSSRRLPLGRGCLLAE